MDDLINRQAAIDALSTPHGILYPIRTIESLPSAQQWIPCSARLPEEKKEVLATIGRNELTIAERWNGDEWFIAEGHWNATTKEISAWMELPKPWKGESDG